ncbi:MULTISPECIES: transglycosylase family protein [Streptomyces]|uniref:Transglycosylase family protein n=2 Tax=Streptomyces TaxID=1883 RepID=A0ABU4K5Q6_9ACTN|nr:transglycosylase family protein [Streptomyces roseolus]MDX2292802.1 transglycosylase family protein [Streptomyces roseolus]
MSPRKRRPSPRTTLAALPLAALALGLLAAPPASAASVATWDEVAECEAGGNWSYYRSGHPYYGGLQFLKSTWDAFGGRQYAEYPHQATKEQQIRIGEKVLATQGEGAWPVCGPRAGLGSDPADPYPSEPAAPQTKMAHLTAVGDLSGDGVPDIVAVEVKTGDLYRYDGPGYVGMGGRTKLGFGWNGMSDLVGVGDQTGDGKADILAVEAATGDLYRYSGPTYNGGSRVKVGTNWDAMANVTGVGDHTGDGVPDLVAVEKATGDLYRYAGPNFTGGTARVKIGVAWNSMSALASVGDLTGDGVTDLVAVEKATGDLYRYSGPAYNGGSRVKLGVNWDSMSNITGVGDVTSDAVPDLLAVETATGNLYRYSGPSFNGGSRTQIGTSW